MGFDGQEMKNYKSLESFKYFGGKTRWEQFMYIVRRMTLLFSIIVSNTNIVLGVRHKKTVDQQAEHALH